MLSCVHNLESNVWVEQFSCRAILVQCWFQDEKTALHEYCSTWKQLYTSKSVRALHAILVYPKKHVEQFFHTVNFSCRALDTFWTLSRNIFLNINSSKTDGTFQPHTPASDTRCHMRPSYTPVIIACKWMGGANGRGTVHCWKKAQQ